MDSCLNISQAGGGLSFVMKTGKRLTIVLTVVLAAALALSCASTGQYLPLSRDETAVAGTVQTAFEARDTWFTRKAINTLAYIKLLEAARPEYPGHIEIRDIVWVSGRVTAPGTSEISASGKVVRVQGRAE
jgi:hypothetical protein